MNEFIYALGIGALVVIIIAIITKQKYCPKCGTKLEKIRIPTNQRQLIHGGWTCPNPKCGCEINWKGELIEKKKK